MPRNIDELKKSREQKLAQIRKAGINPFPIESKERMPINRVVADFVKLEKSAKKITVSGRIRLIRPHGKIAFVQIADEKGKLQLLFKEDELNEEKVRQRFEKRSQLIAAFRQYFIDHEFLEVETPVLEQTPGGADAEPFV